MTLATPPLHPRRLVYLGTPEMGVAPLRALVEAGFDVALVVSRPDAKRGRGAALIPSPVKAAAIELGLAVTDRVDEALEVGAELGVVVAYGRLIRRPVLEQLPMVNLHFSLLPRWRGAAPVERAILAGDAQTGVDLMALEEGLDTGDIYRETIVNIGEEESLDELRARLVAAGTELLLDGLRQGLRDPRPQTGEPTYAAKIEPSELEIDWSAPALQIRRVVRLGNAYTTFRGRRLKVWRVRCGDADADADAGPRSLAPAELDGAVVGTGSGALRLVEVQPEGKPRQAADAWRNGARPVSGERLAS
jgi:methionyl-tRNA formyltransferase